MGVTWPERAQYRPVAVGKNRDQGVLASLAGAGSARLGIAITFLHPQIQPE